MVKCGERLSERDSQKQAFESQPVTRYLGLSLGGAKSERTCLTVIDYYRKQEKAFVVDIYEAVASDGELTADQVLIDLVLELSTELTGQPGGVRVMAVDVPLTLPPCMFECDSECQGYDKCKKPEVRWMRQQYQKAKAKNTKLKHFTPYSQRPVDLYFRYKYPEVNLFQDETMGANLAPQAARMSYLKRYFQDIHLVEVWPKLSLFCLQKPLRLTKREVLDYRHLENGAHVRTRILDRLVEKASLFVYERDMKKLVSNMDAFDSLLCAWVALQTDLGQVEKFKSDLPLESGWVQIPQL